MALIDHSVVRISPDFTGFKEKLSAGLKKASAGVTAKVGVTVDTKRLGADLKKALAGAGGTVRVKLVVDKASTRSMLATSKAALGEDSRQTNAAYRTAERDLSNSVKRRRNTVNSMWSGLTPPKILDFGGAGIRPINLLYASLVALSPVLISVAASAIQASTSFVAIGSAAYGAALGVAGITLAFQGVLGAIALHSSALKAHQGQSVKSAAKDLAQAASLKAAYASTREAVQKVADARQTLIDRTRDERKAVADIALAYRDAAAKVKDLREQLFDLKLQEEGNTLDLADARRKQADVNANFFATELERAQAAHDVKVKLDDLKDTRRDVVTVGAELRGRNRQGLGGSPEVQGARQAAAAATRDQAKAARELSDAIADLATQRTALTTAQKGGTIAANRAVAADGQLAAAIAALSPAGREMYSWLIANTDMFKQMRRSMEQAILPGFLTFLKQVSDRGKSGKGKSVLDVLVDGANAIGRSISRTVAGLGRVFNTRWFKGDLKKLNKDNEKSFTLVGKAATAMVRPITQILVAASPQMVRFAGYLKKIAEQFSAWIDKKQKTGELAAWFKRAGDELSKWWTIAKNLGSTLLSFFKASLPSGQGLVARLGDLTTHLADWAKSKKGQDQLTKFFEFFTKIDYKQVLQIVGAVSLTIATIVGAKAIAKNPLWMLFGYLAAKYPKETIAFMEAIAASLVGVLTYAEKHPQAVKDLILVLGAYKGLAVLKGVKLPAISGLGGAAMSNVVTAAVVGGAVIGWEEFTKGMKGGKFTTLGDALKNPTDIDTWWNYFIDSSGVTLLTLLGRKIVPKFKNFFSITLPNAMNVGVGEGGWSGLATNIGTWFGTTLPNAISGGSGGWSGMGTYMWTQTKEFFGIPMVKGLWAGISEGAKGLWKDLSGWAGDFWGWLKGLFGVHSPSTISAGIGGEIITGLWQGFTTTWTGLLKTVGKWITTNILTPLSTMMGAVGTALKNAFLNPFNTMVTALAGPVKRALDWIDKNLIGKLNALLTKIGVTPIPLINFAMPGAGQVVGGGAGNVARGVAGIIGKADGGPVHGHSPHRRADNIPAWLTAKEFVQPVDAVEHYGTPFMESVRRREFPRMAGGGLVGGAQTAAGPGLVSDVIAGGFRAIRKLSLKDIAGSLVGALFGSGAGGVAVGDASVARVAEAQARSMGATEKQLIALIEAGIVESGLRNLTYGDRDSVGFLQQRAGWGSVGQRMDVAAATAKFIKAAKAKDGPGLTAGQLAQAVQVSAFPGRYAAREADAIAVLNREAPYVAGFTGGGMGGGGGTRAALVAFGRWLQARGYQVSENSAFGGVHAVHAPNSQHYRDNAIDVNHGAGTSRLEQDFLRRIIGEGHSRGLRSIFMTAGHYNHAHFDRGPGYHRGGLVRSQLYDGGGIVPPGNTMVVNRTGANETIRNSAQERALRNNRLDRRDLALLAGYIVSAMQGQVIKMDGRKVAETVRGYDYLPKGI